MSTKVLFENGVLGRQIGFSNQQNLSTPGAGTSLWNQAPVLEALTNPTAYILRREDFFSYTTAQAGFATAGTSATVAIDHLPGGVVKLTTTNSDNGEAYLIGAQDEWLFAANKPLWFEAKLAVTEANTNDADWMIGLMDLAAAACIQDNGAGPLASFDGCVFYKLEETMSVKFLVSNAATQSTATTVKTTYVSGTYYRLGFVFDPNDGTTGIITPWFDGVAQTSHNILLSGLTDEMQIVFGVKASSSNTEIMRVDWVQVLGVR